MTGIQASYNELLETLLRQNAACKMPALRKQLVLELLGGILILGRGGEGDAPRQEWSFGAIETAGFARLEAGGSRTRPLQNLRASRK
jgi:hypothetical protein